MKVSHHTLVPGDLVQMDFTGRAFVSKSCLLSPTTYPTDSVQMMSFGVGIVLAVTEEYEHRPGIWATMVMCSATGTVGWVWSNWLEVERIRDGLPPTGLGYF